MSIPARQLLTLLVTVTLVASGTVGIANATTDAGDSTQATPELECADTPLADHSDPASDVIGWENGTWYDESLDVDQSDGLNVSEQRAIVDRTMARVEAIRCIEFEESVDVSVIDRGEFRERLEGGNLTVEMTPELRTFDNAKFEAMFLVDQSEDSIEVQEETLGTAVLGFYSPETNEIALVAEDREALRIDEATLAHELLHAWQDQEHNLSSEKFAPRIRDESNARNGLVEGDASYVDTLYERRCEEGAWDGTCLTPETAMPAEGDIGNMGVYLLEFQPYSDGPVFVRFVQAVGGWDAVDRLYDRPPATTEQVIHVEKYRSDEPTDVELTDRTTDDWKRVTVPGRPDHGSVGEAGLMSMFVYPFYHSEGADQIIPPTEWLNFDEDGEVSEFNPIDYRSNYSDGWDGDRLHVYQRDGNQTAETGESPVADGTPESNETASVWRLAWDSPQDAAQFVAGYDQVLQYWGAERVEPRTYHIDDGGFAGAYHVSISDRAVTIVKAPTVDQLDDVRTDIGNETSEP